MNTIQTLGFNNWFWESSVRSPLDIPLGKDKVDLSKTDFNIVRVISVSKNSFVVSNGVKDIYAELTGKFLFNSEELLDGNFAGGDTIKVNVGEEAKLAFSNNGVIGNGIVV